MALVITACTNRKRKPVSPGLCMSEMPASPLAGLAAIWSERLHGADSRYPAGEVYGGRGFVEAAAAAREAGARLCVASAGVGLVSADTAIPAYACTILDRAHDSVGVRVAGPFDAAAWWHELGRTSPFAQPLAAFDTGGPLLVALSGGYLEMLAGELLALPPENSRRLRLFTRAAPDGIAAELQRFVMPYDDRLDGPDSPLRGTRGDFAARALRHFVSLAGTGGSLEADAATVEAGLAGWRMHARRAGARHDDATLRGLLDDHWERAGGSSSRLLRLFRDDLGVACEQSRFAALARQVREARA